MDENAPEMQGKTFFPHAVAVSFCKVIKQITLVLTEGKLSIKNLLTKQCPYGHQICLSEHRTQRHVCPHYYLPSVGFNFIFCLINSLRVFSFSASFIVFGFVAEELPCQK